MNREAKNYLNQLECQLRSMHQPHEFVDQDRFESDFQREFGVGDERPVKPINIYKGYEDADQLPEDFC